MGPSKDQLSHGLMANAAGREGFALLIKSPDPTGPRGGERGREKVVREGKQDELWKGTPETTVPGHSTEDRPFRYQPARATGRCLEPYVLTRAVLTLFFIIPAQTHKDTNGTENPRIKHPRPSDSLGRRPFTPALSTPHSIQIAASAMLYIQPTPRASCSALSLPQTSVFPSLKEKNFLLLLPTSNISGKVYNKTKLCL